ncbi:hypothetical protein ACIBF5_31855, partial [Micromonospora sp. NPDC050417]|uniref:hypothetical protein n=1 Tax=Micromonospora sp. NPDC050417 TaxID=3364280 RepID=UPI0037A17D05
TASALLRSYAMYNDPTPANIPPIMAPSMLIKLKNLAFGMRYAHTSDHSPRPDPPAHADQETVTNKVPK